MNSVVSQRRQLLQSHFVAQVCGSSAAAVSLQVITDDSASLHQSTSHINMTSAFQHSSADHIDSVSNMSSFAGKFLSFVARDALCLHTMTILFNVSKNICDLYQAFTILFAVRTFN